jgi:RNA polymerase sigma factor (sigma-70 family)
MADEPMRQVVQELRRVALASHDELSDAQLLERFVRARDESAFAALLWRHGPMVLGVCRRLLGHTHDAEDAFQATFLVLVRKAAGLRRPALVGNWLYGVACRTARQARTAAARRQARERAAARPEAREEPMNDWRPVLDQALHLLPDRYRAAIVLCDLEGKSYREAALALGCAEGTLAARLSRGRALLARRLGRQGVALGGPALATLLAGEASAALPTALAASTIQAATAVAAGQATAAVSALALAERVMRTMFLTKVTWAGAALLLLTLGTGLGLLAYRAPGEEPAERPKQPAAAVKRDAGPPPVDRSMLRYGGERFDHWVVLLVTELKPEMRTEAIKALGAFAVNGYAKEAVPAIIGAVRGHDIQADRDAQRMINAALTALSRLGAPAVPALAKELKGGTPTDRRFAVTALKEMLLLAKTREAVSLLHAAVKDEDQYVRVTAAEALIRNDENLRSLPVLLAGLDSDAPTQYRAVENLGALGQKAKPAIPRLLELARTGMSSGRPLKALRKIGAEPKTVLPVLIDVLQKGWAVRPGAPGGGRGGGFGGRGDPFVGVSPADLLEASSYLRSLKLPASEAVPALIIALNHVQDPDELGKIVAALADFGPAAREAIPSLTSVGERLGDRALVKAIDRAIQIISK